MVFDAVTGLIAGGREKWLVWRDFRGVRSWARQSSGEALAGRQSLATSATPAELTDRSRLADWTLLANAHGWAYFSWPLTLVQPNPTFPQNGCNAIIAFNAANRNNDNKRILSLY